LVLQNPHILGIDLIFDEFKGQLMITATGPELEHLVAFSGGLGGFEGGIELGLWTPVTDAVKVQLRQGLELLGFKFAPKEIVSDALVLIAGQRRMDSAIQWLSSLKWDGIDRVSGFFSTYFHAENNEYTRAAARYHWAGAAARVMDAGHGCDMSVILVGGQGVGKTRGIKAMCPDGSMYREIDFHISENDRARMIRGCLVAEIAELSGMKTREIESIKKYMTRTEEQWVEKFQSSLTFFKRRCMFIGTTNDTEILNDSTGNRRFIPMVVGLGGKLVDLDGLARDVEQLWAQGLVEFERNGVQWAGVTRVLEKHQQPFLTNDTWEDHVQPWITGDRGDGFGGKPEVDSNGEIIERPFTMSQIITGLFGPDLTKQTKANQMRLSGVLRKLGYDRRQFRGEQGRTMYWVRVQSGGKGWAGVKWGVS
jgi:predicted P-loop ATPase